MFYYCYSLQKGALLNMKVAISYASCNLGPEALNDIYTNLATVSPTQTIIVTGNWGAATSDPEIARAKGWTVTL